MIVRMKGILAVALLCVATTARADLGPPPDTFVAEAAAMGPAPTIMEACAEPEIRCKKKKLKKAKLVAPYLGLGLIERRTTDQREEHLGIQTDAGWYLFPLLSWGTSYGGKATLKITSVKIKDVVPGGAPEVLVTGKRNTSSESSSYQRHGDKEELLWVCGIGDSGAPSCVEVVLARDSTPSDMEEGATRYKFRLGYKFTADGKLTRKVKGKWPKNARTMDGELDRAGFENTWGFLFR